MAYIGTRRVNKFDSELLTMCTCKLLTSCIDVFKFQPSLSFITTKAAAPPDCATSAFSVKSQSPRMARTIDPDNYKSKRRPYLSQCLKKLIMTSI